MAKKFNDGVWLLERDEKTPDSERNTERDDALFATLDTVFQGEESQLDFETMAHANQVTPAEIFNDIHENYGYICIGTGENPAMGEKLTDAEKVARQQAIKEGLEAEKIPHVLIKGKYMGVEENTYFIPFNDKSIGLPTVLQGEMVKNVEKIAQTFNQDSLLICQNGYACYLYTFGPQQGNVITGKTAVVYPGESQLPEDCYSLFINANGEGTVGFTCGLNFDRVYTSIDEFSAEENKTLQQQYPDFVTECVPQHEASDTRKKTVILLRGANGYNAYASELKDELSLLGLKAAIFGSDANIAKINEEVAQDNLTAGPKAGWQWPQIRGEFIRRNKAIYQLLLNSDDVDVIIYADMNKVVEFMEPYVSDALHGGHHVMSHVVNSFVFEPLRSDYAEKLCDQYGAFMARHVRDFKSEKGQINAESLRFGESVIEQSHGLTSAEVANKIAVGTSAIIHDHASASAMTSGLVGTLFAQSSGIAPDQIETSKMTSTPVSGM